MSDWHFESNICSDQLKNIRHLLKCYQLNMDRFSTHSLLGHTLQGWFDFLIQHFITFIYLFVSLWFMIQTDGCFFHDSYLAERYEWIHFWKQVQPCLADNVFLLTKSVNLTKLVNSLLSSFCFQGHLSMQAQANIDSIVINGPIASMCHVINFNQVYI